MRIKVTDARKLSEKALQKMGFPKEIAKLTTRNLIEAELAGRKSHGFIRIPALKRQIEKDTINIKGDDIEIISETATSLYINGKSRPGFYVIYKSLDLAFKKLKKAKVITVGLKNIGYASGYIGDYAREAAERNLIFVGFHNSPGGLVPYGAKKELWGTNPITVGIPTTGIPVILDMASSKTTFGELLVARQEGKKIREGVAIDTEGKPTTDSQKAIDGGILPIAEHKGSGLAFIIELLAGALTGSRVGYAVEGGWGSFYILIDPTLFRSLSKFRRDVDAGIKELKSAPKMRGFKEIYFPGEQSQSQRRALLKKGELEIENGLLKLVKQIAGS